MTPRTRVFLDASYAIALAISGDPYHSQALKLADRLEELSATAVTTRAVMLEIGNALSGQRFRQQAISLLTDLDNDPNVGIVQITESLYQRALRLFQDRPDKDWGLTDCLSFIVMQDYDLTDALTSDNHFRQAGFERCYWKTRYERQDSAMPNQKFTVFLIPDTHGYQAIIPHYPEAITFGSVPDEAFANAKEALSLILEDEREPIPPNIHASHVIVGDIELDIPHPLLEEVRKEPNEYTQVEAGRPI